jgi:hypothetical protein
VVAIAGHDPLDQRAERHDPGCARTEGRPRSGRSRPHRSNWLRSAASGAVDESSNVRVKQINAQIRLIARRAFAFHSPEVLIALAMLKLADLCPPLLL